MKRLKIGVLVLLAGILVGGLVNEMAAWAGLSQPITISFTSITGTSAQYNQTATTDDGTGAITFNGTGAPNIVNNTTGNLLVIHGGTSGFRIRNNAGTGTRLDLTDAGVFTIGAGTIGSGTAGTTSGGYLLSGSTSGTVSILPQAAAGTYNFNMPTTAGAVGAVLLSQGGAASAMTWLADVAVGQALMSGGVATNPAYSSTPTLGIAGTTAGTLGLSGATLGVTTLGTAASTTSYTLTLPASAGVQGALLSTTNATGATTWSATPTLGLAGTTTGKLLLSGVTSGVVTVQPQSVAGTYNFTLPAAAGVQGALLSTTDAVGTLTETATPTLGLAGTTTGTLAFSGATSGVVTVQPQTAAGTYNFNLPTTAGAVGAILTSGGGAAAAMPWLADVATGQVLTSGGVGVIPAFSGTPSVTSATFSGTADKTILVSNGGHISSLLGTGVAVTASTGVVTAGSTDNAGEVTGGTSPVTVTFGVGFAVKPVCICSDETSATQTCKAVPNVNGLNFVATTTGTDSFGFLCLGK